MCFFMRSARLVCMRCKKDTRNIRGLRSACPGGRYEDVASPKSHSLELELVTDTEPGCIELPRLPALGAIPGPAPPRIGVHGLGDPDGEVWEGSEDGGG